MKTKHFIKKLSVLVFTAVFCFSSVAVMCPFESRASVVDDGDIVDFIYRGLGYDYNKIKNSFVYAYNKNFQGFGTFVDGTRDLITGPPTGSVGPRPGIIGKNLSYYQFPTKNLSGAVSGTGKSLKVLSKDGIKQATYPSEAYNGVVTTNNNYKQVDKHTAVTVESSFNTTTNNYDYSYKVYNPVTNNYFTTNNFTYNTTYNTYNFVTNNYNYTTNYYIQDNRTYISYYIVNVNNETGNVEDETYTEMYYELPDGRSSYNLKASDLKGVYFPGRFTKYVSQAEDDGTTLGLWHLDGDLKDSSFWDNTAGSAYNNKYTDGYWTETLGKSLSDSNSDFFELKLDKVELPGTWTLEWLEYVPGECSFNSSERTYVGDYVRSSGNNWFFDGPVGFDYSLNNYFSLEGFSGFFPSSSGSFVPYAIVKSSSGIRFYRNGVLVDALSVDTDAFDKCKPSVSGISVTSDCIRFNVISDTYVYGPTDFIYYRVGSEGANYYVRRKHTCTYNVHKNSVIDEVRLSSGALYTGDSYVPSSQPFTTNTVLTVPEDAEDNEISFFTNTDISDVRFGGVRPTYPTNGYVYVHLDDNENVDSVQQYQQDGWYEIEASIYYNGSWELLKGFDLSNISIDPGEPDNPDNPDPDNPDNPGTGTPSEPDKPGTGGDVDGLLESIGKFFSAILSGIVTLLKPFIDGLSALVGGIADGLASIVTLMGGSFSGFLKEAFAFIPEDIVNVIVLGVSLAVLVSLIRIFRG